MVSYFCMYFKGGTPTKAGGKRKERKIIEKLGKEVFTDDNVSVSVSLLVSLGLHLNCIVGEERGSAL